MGRTLVIEILIIKVIPRPGYNTSWNFRRNFYSGGSIEFLRNFLETCTGLLAGIITLTLNSY